MDSQRKLALLKQLRDTYPLEGVGPVTFAQRALIHEALAYLEEPLRPLVTLNVGKPKGACKCLRLCKDCGGLL